MTTIPVRLTSTDDTMSDIWARQVVTAVFHDPVWGGDIPVIIRLFQLPFGTEGFGVGVYMADEAGEPARGTVLRWDDGPGADPTVIQWQAPHCKDDACGAPCGHVPASNWDDPLPEPVPPPLNSGAERRAEEAGRDMVAGWDDPLPGEAGAPVYCEPCGVHHGPPACNAGL